MMKQPMAVGAIMLLAAASALAEDISTIPDRAGIPPGQRPRNGYSDFTDPLGRFMDLLSAGDAGGAKAIQAEACAEWQRTRKTSAWTGKFWVWTVQVDLDSICAP